MTITEKNDLETRIKVLREQIKPLQDRLDKIKLKEEIEKARNIIGKCYAFPNSHGHPDSDEWLVYRKIIGLDVGELGVGLVVLSCQEIPGGMIEFATRGGLPSHYAGENVNEEYIKRHEITPEEFDKQFNELLGKIKS